MSEPVKVETTADLDPIFEESHQHPVLLFKHSLTCPISGAAFREYQSFLAQRDAAEAERFKLVEIQRARDVSNEIAQRTGVRHESPQAILLSKGEAVWNASHWKIRRESLEQAVADHPGT